MKITVKAKPNAKKEEVREEGDAYIVSVTEPPRQGKANWAIVRALAAHFKVPVARVRIVSGFTGRVKVVEVEDRAGKA